MASASDSDKLTETITIRLSPVVYAWLLRKAANEHRSMSRTAAMILQTAHDQAEGASDRGPL